MTVLEAVPRAACQADVVVPHNYAFSRDGMQVACALLRYSAQGDVTAGVEIRTFRASGEETRRRDGLPIEATTEFLPLPGGRVLVLPNNAPVQDLLAVEDHEGKLSVRRVARIRTGKLGGYLLPVLAPDGGGLLVSLSDDAASSVIWSVPDARELARIPGVLTGGVWSDRAGRRIVFNQRVKGQPADAIVVDLGTGTWDRLFTVSTRSQDRVVLADPDSGRLVLSTNASGEHRLGWAIAGADNPAHFPPALHRPGYDVTAVALERGGGRLLVERQQGVRTLLATYSFDDDVLTPVDCPDGRVLAVGTWAEDAIRVPFSTPAAAGVIGSIDAKEPSRATWRIAGPERGTSASLAPRVAQLAGPAGPVEALVYGCDDWVASTHLVVALHGGPLASWQFAFHPLFDALAAAGVAVVAPNYRGSVGYGRDHTRAVLGDWGGPDLDDVLGLAESLIRERPGSAERPIVLGASYGGFLALLAAVRAPGTWSGCVAIAPFLSASRLALEGTFEVRERVSELGGVVGLSSVGGRDVIALASQLRRLLLIHGRDDVVVPVTQSRLLRERLLDLGRREGSEFDYDEPAGDHETICAGYPSRVRNLVTQFCTRSRGTGIGGHG